MSEHKSPITFEIKRRSGEVITVLVDEEDWDRVAKLTWSPDARGYVVRSRRGEQGVKLHRFILGLKKGDPMVDHVNGNKADNRKSNLRLSDPVRNGLNLANENFRGRSKFRGVTYHNGTGKWRATTRIAGKHYSLGLHATEAQAFEALKDFRSKKGIDGHG